MPKDDPGRGSAAPRAPARSARRTEDPAAAATLAPIRAACAAFDPLPLADALERMAELTVRAQGMFAAHAAQTGLAITTFAANRAMAQVEAARQLAAAPSPAALPAIWAHVLAGSVADAAEEMRRIGHVAARAVGEAGEQTRAATHICMAVGRPADID